MFCDAQHLDVETLILLETDLHFKRNARNQA